MRKKDIFTLLLTIFGISLTFAQNKQLIVHYDYDLFLSGIEKKRAVLQQNNEVGIFSYKNVTDSEDIEVEDDGNYKFNFKDTTTLYIYYNKVSKQNIELLKDMDKQVYQIITPIEDLNWEITDETKDIEGYASVKAKTRFKGRNYEVWFTPEIPAYFGPIKLHGLPGLILAIQDDEKKVLISANKISYSEKPLQLPTFDQPIITMKEYKEKVESGFKEWGNRVSTKMGRNVKMKINSIKFSTLEIEE